QIRFVRIGSKRSFLGWKRARRAPPSPGTRMITHSRSGTSLSIFLVVCVSACSATEPSPSGLAGTDESTGRIASALSTTSVTFGGDELRTGWYSDEAALAPSVVG